MIRFIERIKFLLIDYFHLIILVFILFSLFINNMPVNFQYEKLIDFIPKVLNVDVVKEFGIEDAKNSKLYSILSWLYGTIRSSLSPIFKSMLFKIIMLIFLSSFAADLGSEEFLTDEVTALGYSNMFMAMIILVWCISGLFWLILGSGDLANYFDKDNSYSKFIKEIFQKPHTDSPESFMILNPIISTMVMVAIWFFLHNYKNDSHINQIIPPIIITLFIIFSILFLYFKIDGILSFGTAMWEDIIVPSADNWWTNMTGAESTVYEVTPDDDSTDIIGRWVYFVIYLLIFIAIICLHYVNYDTLPNPLKFIKNNNIFNNLIERTNHPLAILTFYVYFFLLRTTYSKGWLTCFVIFSIIESLAEHSSGVASAFTGKLGAKFGMSPGQLKGVLLKGKRKFSSLNLSSIKGAASDLKSLKKISPDLKSLKKISPDLKSIKGAASGLKSTLGNHIK